MEVRPGYKQTEVGVIPEDWEVKHLGELATVSAGGTPSRNIPQFWNGEIPWITTSELDFNTIRCAQQFITRLGLNSSAARLLPAGTLLIALYGQGKTRGKVGILGFDAATNQACAAISLRPNIHPQFIFHFLESQYEQIRKLSNTGNQENLNGSLVRGISILYPPLPEQRAIAEALSDVDELLGALDRLIAKKRDLKQAAMQQLLTGQTRLPGFSGNWETRTLGDVILKGRLGGNYPNVSQETQYPLMKMGNLARSRMDLTKVEYITAGIYPDPQHKLTKGDVLFNTRNTMDLVGKVAIWHDELPLAYYNSNLMRLEFNPRHVCSNEYANAALNTANAIATLRGLATGTTSVAAIYTRDLVKLTLFVPPVEEQTAIAEVLSDMDAEIEALEQRREKTRLLKQGMMQELLSGRTRIV